MAQVEGSACLTQMYILRFGYGFDVWSNISEEMTLNWVP